MYKIKGEFKINHKWINGEIIDIDKLNNIFLIKPYNENELIEMKNSNIIFYNEIINNILNESNYNNINFNVNENVEFYDSNLKCFLNGVITSKKGKFYCIKYINDKALYNSQIIYENNIRKKLNNRDLIKLNINNFQEINLNNYDISIDISKNIIKQFYNLFENDIEYIFLNKDNSKIFIYCNHDKINEELIDELIKVTLEFYKDVDNLFEKNNSHLKINNY